MNLLRITSITVLGSVTAALAVLIMRDLSKEAEYQAVDDSESDAKQQPPGGTQSPTGANVAIAAPETLPVQQVSDLATAAAIATVQSTADLTINGLATGSLKTTVPKTTSARGQGRNPQSTSTAGPVRRPWVTLKAPMQAIAPPENIMRSGATQSAYTGQDASVAPIDVSLSDIHGHWAQYYIEFLANRFIVRGFPDGRFRPDRAITATEFNHMVQKASHLGGIAPISYSQVQSRIPNRAVTRADAAAFIYRAIVRTELVESVTSVQVSGAVLRPGRYSLAAASDARLGQGNNLPTLSRAIQQAGGVLASADLRQVEIHRRTDTGERKVIKVDVWKVRAEKDLAQDVVIQQNDRIVIPAIAATTPTQPRQAIKPPAPVSPPPIANQLPATVSPRLNPRPAPPSPQPVPTPTPAIAPVTPATPPASELSPDDGALVTESDRPLPSPEPVILQ